LASPSSRGLGKQIELVAIVPGFGTNVNSQIYKERPDRTQLKSQS